MEYLMTYGWIIIILAFVGVAFYALGVLNPITFAGRTVTGFQVLGTPMDWELQSANGNLTLKLVNGRMSTPVTIHGITATINGQSTQHNPAGLAIGPGASGTVSFPVTPVMPPGSAYSARIAITYDSGGLNHTDVGTVTGAVS